jgi:hypothetical protein
VISRRPDRKDAALSGQEINGAIEISPRGLFRCQTRLIIFCGGCQDLSTREVIAGILELI